MLLFTVSIYAQEIQEDALNGKPAYNFQVITLSGQKISLADYEGKVLLINIWVIPCPKCIKEFPSFIELYSNYKTSGFEVLGLTKALYSDSSSVKKNIKKYKLNYPNVITTNELIKSIGGVKGIPTTYVIDKNGKIYK